MYRYQTKHKILSLLLVFSLLILTPALVLPSPASANLSSVWNCPDVPIDIFLAVPDIDPQYCSDNIVPPLTEVSMLRFTITRPPFIASLAISLEPEDTVLINYIIDHWESVPPHTINVTPSGPFDIIEVTFSPPLESVERVCLANMAPATPDFVTVDSLQLEYSPQNQPPVADANGPYSGSVGSSITFNGSDSYDPDEPYGDKIVSWDWEFTGDGKYDDASGEIVQWSWGSPYSGFIGLNVTDAQGASDTDEAEVNVTLAPTPPPVTEVGGEVYPINRVSVLAPWIVLSAAIIAGAIIAMRRRRTQS